MQHHHMGDQFQVRDGPVLEISLDSRGEEIVRAVVVAADARLSAEPTVGRSVQENMNC